MAASNDASDSRSRITRQSQELRERIAEAGLTFAEFGRRVGLSRNRLYKILTNQAPDIELRKRIDQVLAQRHKTRE